MDRDSNGLGAVTPPGTASPAPPAPPATRRAILAAALGGVAGAVASALGRAPDAQAAAGDPLILGQQNFAGNSATRLSATSSGGAFWMTQNGSGSGVRGESWNGTGGVFVTHHPDRQGLLAQQLGTAGTGAAIRAEGGPNRGVSGFSDSNVGVFGTSGAGNGVVGMSNSGYGVAGVSTIGTGVVGEGLLYAGYFIGDCHVSGLLSKTAGSFRIDHPLDPARKYLQHSFVESPDMKNVYDGVVTADERGEATVELPSWFSALNRDLRYQLTPIGAAMPELHIKTAFKDGAFVIAGARPGHAVSWQLTGIRRDAWAEAHRIAVEVDKAGDERGRYLHPDVHGQPASKGIDHERRARGLMGPSE